MGTLAGAAAVSKGIQAKEEYEKLKQAPEPDVNPLDSKDKSKRLRRLEPDPEAQGPHSTFKKDPVTGETTGYITYDKVGKPTKRYRGKDGKHGGVKPPLVIEPERGKKRGAPLRRTRPAFPEEKPTPPPQISPPKKEYH